MIALLCEVVNAAIDYNNRGCVLYRRGKKLTSRLAFQAASSILRPLVHWQLQHVGNTWMIKNRLLSTLEEDGREGEEEPTANNIIPNDQEEAILRFAHNAMIAAAATQYDNNVEEEILGTTDSVLATTCSSRFSEGLLSRDAIILPPHNGCCCSNYRCCNSNTTKQQQQCGSSMRLIMMTAAVVMNLALTFLDECEHDMVHALALFESAYSLAIKEPVTCYLSEQIALISLNNATQLQNELGDWERTKEYADTLIRLINALPFSLDGTRRELRSRFMLNAIVMKCPIIARAA